MSRAVLDTSAILALLDEEPGSALVREMIATSVISTVNLAEAYSKLANRGADGRAALAAIRFAIQEIVPFTERMAELTGELRPHTAHLGLSLGDRACLALGIALKAEVITADRLWRQLDLPCTVRLIR